MNTPVSYPAVPGHPTVPNQPTMQPQTMSGLLSQVAIVAVVTTTSLGLGRTDKQASKETERDHDAADADARVTVNRLAGAKDRVKEIRNVQRQAQETLTKYTTAWSDKRLLPNVNIQKFMEEWHKAKAEHERLVAKLVEDAPALIEKAQEKLGTFDVAPPTVDEIRDAFSLDFKIDQIPDATHFKSSGLDQQIEAALKRRFEADIAAAYQHAQRDAIERLAEPLKKLAEKMEGWNEREAQKARGVDVGREGSFQESIITNVTEIGEVFSTFNLTKDPNLQKIADQLRGFDGIEAKDLRTNKQVRDDTAARAKAILAQLGDWIK